MFGFYWYRYIIILAVAICKQKKCRGVCNIAFPVLFSVIMCKIATFFGLAVGALLLAGCTEFLAVSGADAPAGGVYKLQAEGTFQIVKSSKLNCLVRVRDSKRLYGTTLRGGGGLVVLDEVPFGGYIEAKTVAAGGKTPCHLTLSPDGSFLYTANYSSGSVSEFRLEEGLPVGRPRLIRHTGRGVKPRQKSPHPHFVRFDAAGKRLYVCDLGLDKIFVYDWTPGTGLKTPAAAELVLPPGSGPRHLVFAPDGNTLYVANELDSTAASFVREAPGKAWRFGKVRSTLPDGADKKDNYPGAIRITADGRYFFVANRGDNSVAVFAASGGGDFRLVRTVPSGGDFPSDLLLLNGDRLLVVSHLRSGGVTSFDLEDGKLTPSVRYSVPKCAALCE